jgi:RNA polymerase sigma-70 factor (ECF subfamily)
VEDNNLRRERVASARARSAAYVIAGRGGRFADAGKEAGTGFRRRLSNAGVAANGAGHPSARSDPSPKKAFEVGLHRFGGVRTLRGVELAADSGVVPSAVDSDESLWRRSLDGDGEAFGALFDGHRARVFRHACRLAHTQHDAEDVVASAFLELWRRRADVRLVDGSVLPWLLVTATNLGRNTARGTRRYRRFLERLPRAPDQPDVAEVALGTHGLGVDAQLRAGLRALNKTDACLFVLVALEDYPVAAAAAQLELSLSGARARLHRVRTGLREQLSDHPPGKRTDDQGDKR